MILIFLYISKTREIDGLEAVDNPIADREVLIGAVRALETDAGHAGRLGRPRTVRSILNDDAVPRVHAQISSCLQVYGGIWLRLGQIRAAHEQVEVIADAEVVDDKGNEIVARRARNGPCDRRSSFVARISSRLPAIGVTCVSCRILLNR